MTLRLPSAGPLALCIAHYAYSYL